MNMLCWNTTLIVALFLPVALSYTDGIPINADARVLAEDNDTYCYQANHTFDPFKHKTVYRIGVDAIRGFDAAQEEYGTLFSEYLTATAGLKFSTPIEFELVPYTFEGFFQAIDNDELDFIFANPSIYSCIGTEVGASPLATVVSQLEVRGHSYQLDVFGGVIATRADNEDINNIDDLRDKIIAAGSISTLMSGQLQFYEMEKAGLSYVNDPKQVVLTNNQFDVVNGVLSGEYDVGLVRTDTIERTVGPDGELIDSDLFKVIEPKIYVLDDGNLFPFLHSTDIYPEWPVAALPHIADDVAFEVQEALLAIGQHASLGQKLEKCRKRFSVEECAEMSFPWDFEDNPRCDTTEYIAELAWEARQMGSFSGFRPSRSYFELRTMQEAAGFLLQDEKGDWYCTRASSLYDGINCPDGYYKRRIQEFEQGCSVAELPCKEGYDCFCQPCVRAHVVDVYEYIDGADDTHLVDFFGESLDGCDKMSICGSVQQGRSIKFRAYDNMQREGAVVTVRKHSGDEDVELEVSRVPGTYAYEFSVSNTKMEVQVIEIFVDGEQIPDSPIRVMIDPLDCDSIHGHNSRREADADGVCQCEDNAYEVAGECIRSEFFFVIIFAGVSIVMAALVFLYLGYKKKQNDSVWHINVDELHFNEPPEVVGQGAFGVVILGHYRGTKVAVKRVLPPKAKSRGSSTHGNSSDSRELRQSSSRSELRQSSRSHSPRSRPKRGSNRDVQFQNGGDIEQPHHSEKRDTQEGMSSVRNWKQLVKPQKKNAVLRVLESATVSHQDSSNLLLGRNSSRAAASVIWPLWLRFDEHSRLKREFLAEMRLLSRLRHPCITTVMGAVITPSVDPMLVMEFMDHGSLHDLLRNETMYAGGDILLQVIRDIIQGIRFLHASKPPILHGDLKAKNILVDSRFRAKVADFGFSHLKQEKHDLPLQGTPYFMAPEYLRRDTEYTGACDVYALGMIFFEIYARKDPFEGENPEVLLPKICHPRINKRPPVPNACPPKVAELMKKCWNSNPFFRPTAKDLDYALVELTAKDAEPLEHGDHPVKDSLPRKATSLYDVFPKHIADALNAGKKVEPESHDSVTIVFSDIVGFTEISQTFTALKVALLLDRLYQAFDSLAKKHEVFKVETIGDAWMGVTNLDESQGEDHAKRAAEFAIDVIVAASSVLVDEEDPSRGSVKIRLGLHSGPVVSNVIGSLNPRYGLFGDTVNTASRMETNSKAGRILCSPKCAELLLSQAPSVQVKVRGKLNIKGKGKMITYWVGSDTPHEEADALVAPNLPAVTETKEGHQEGEQEEIANDMVMNQPIAPPPTKDADLRTNRMVNMLLEQIKRMVRHQMGHANEMEPFLQNRGEPGQVVIRENGEGPQVLNDNDMRHETPGDSICLDEIKDSVEMRSYSSSKSVEVEAASVVVPPDILAQLGEFVRLVVASHRNNPFHSFEHTSFVAENASNLLKSITDGSVETSDATDLEAGEGTMSANLHLSSNGIASDPMVAFAITFSVLIHNVDHQGVPNTQLVREEPAMGKLYRNKSTGQQNALDVAWDLLMSGSFLKLRQFVFGSQSEMLRFRKLVIHNVLATDILDMELNNKRKSQWDRAFSRTLPLDQAVDLRATLIMENIVQASIVGYTMQGWDCYLKWTKNLFMELHKAFKAGRLAKDPVSFWYESQVGFFDNFVLPLTKRLEMTNAFDTERSASMIGNAQQNREDWQRLGRDLVQTMVRELEDDTATENCSESTADCREVECTKISA